jgi:glycosyltransferase involved in cell wall biosynthesis
MIKFSIGIPAFKSKFFEECISSILTQSYRNFELLIIDDHSPDNLKSIVDKFQDNRITYSRNDVNTGAENVVDNWNRCLVSATGDYFILMGDDDKMESNYLEEFVTLINKYPDLNVYHCRSKIIDFQGKVLGLTPSWPEFENVYDNIWHRISEKRTQYISDFVYRLNPLKQKGGFYKLPLAWGSDDISSFLACGSRGIAHTNLSVFNYRSNDLSITSSGNFMLKLKANREYYLLMSSFLKSKQPMNDIDSLIVWENLVDNYDYFLRKRNINAIAKSINSNYLNNTLKLIISHKEFKLKLSDTFTIILKVFKNKFF